MLKDIYVIDNALKNPDAIIDWSNEQEYDTNKTHLLSDNEKTYWKGVRTKPLHEVDENKTNMFAQELMGNLFNDFKIGNENVKFNLNWQGVFYFHKLSEKDKFENIWLHKDHRYLYAGVLYLNKNPPINSGTVIYKCNNLFEVCEGKHKNTYVENVFNRMVLYKSHMPHSSMGGFGSLENPRLTLTMFFSRINVGVELDSPE
jgi:hypothetical protein